MEPEPKVIIEEVKEIEDETYIFFDEAKFTPPPVPEVDPLDLELRECTLLRPLKSDIEKQVN
jgi:hypothetical protein